MQTSQAVIIILLVANLVATIWFGLNDAPQNMQTQAEKVSVHELPAFVNSDARQSLFDDFANAFNASDFDALYDLFSPAAKAQFSKQESDSEFGKLAKYFKSVEDGAFSHSELVSTQGNTNIYVLHYAVKLPEASEFGTSGTLKITLAVQGQEYQVYGIYLNAGST